MMQAIWNRRNSEEGFTLVEMLVVIAIIGILAGVAVFAIGGTQKDSKAAACKSDVAVVQTASDAYYAKNGAYAADVPALVTAKLLRSNPMTKTVATDGYALTYTVADGSVSATPANCAVS